MDLGYSYHITFSKEAFIKYDRLQKPIYITTAIGVQLQGVAIDIVGLKVILGDLVKPITLSGILYVPGLSGNLISVLQL